jgi:PAS domain S-box-containing protein
MQPNLARVALRTGCLYGLVGALWILLSDRLLVALVSDSNSVNQLQTYKGWAFVAVTAVLLYVTLRGQLRRWEGEAAARKQSEAALRESQMRLAGILDTAMDAIISVDTEQRIVLFNAAAEKMFGRSAGEAVGQTLDHLIPERFRAAHGEHIRRFVQTGLTSRQMGTSRALTGLRADGREFPVEASAISQIEIGEQKLFTVILRDITERKRAEEVIQRNMERIQALNEIETAITSTLDLQGVLNVLLEKIELFLPVAAASTVRLLNLSTGAMEALASRGRLQASSAAGSRAAIVAETLAPMAVLNIHKDSRTRNPLRHAEVVSYLGVPLIAHEKVLGVLSIYTREEHEFGTDEIELVKTLAAQAAISIHNAQLFEQISQQARKLESANRVKNEFLSVMSHELRTPLSITMGYVGMMKEGLLGAVTPEQEEALQKVINQSADQLRMVNDIMETTYLESRTATVERQLVNLSDFFRHLKSDLEATRERNQAALVWEYPQEPLPIVTDGRKLRQIVQNLVSNAIKFTDHGKVTLSVKTVSRSPNLPLFDDERHERKDTDQWLEIKVRDTGRGIPPDKLDAIFEKFYQLDTSDTRLYGGLGLGLYITKQFTELLGGKITVESEVSEGSTFTVTIPYSN